MIFRRWLLALLLLPACAPQGTVTRIADGTREDGRFIDAVAYSAYARAALLEAAGDTRGALAAYQAALDADPESADIQTRIAALLCRMGSGRAVAAFEHALELDRTYSVAYAERARCLERQGKLGPALAQARLAVQYDADRIDFSELVARLLFSLGRKEEAWIWLDALVAQKPSSPQAWRVFRTLAELDGDPARLRRARAAERGLGVSPGESPAQGGSDPIDALLLARDLEGARRAAISRRWKASELALRALELGAHEVAREQGRFVLLADPADADAWIAVLVAAEQLHDEASYAEALHALDPDVVMPSPRGAEQLAALLARQVSESAGQAFRAAFARRVQ